MSDHEMARRPPFQQNQYARRRAHRPLDIADTLPSQEELDSVPHKGDAADRFTLYSPEQIEAETRTVRLDVSFEDVIKIRDQAEMIIEACKIIIARTRAHDIGSIRQRIECRGEAASLGRALSRFNGKTPYGDTKKKRDKY
ncbi:MAG TPA: hypothetical protein VF442_02975 [Sphingobium sp.]